MKKIITFARKKPVLFAAIATVIAMLIWAVELDGDAIGGPDMVATHILTSAIALFLMSILSILPTAGFRKKGLLHGLLLGIPFYVLGIASALFSNWGIDLAAIREISLPSVLLFTLYMFMVGLGEEVLFRGLLLNNFLVAWGDTKEGMVKAVWVSAAIFGAVHLLNVAAGCRMGITSGQKAESLMASHCRKFDRPQFAQAIHDALCVNASGGQMGIQSTLFGLKGVFYGWMQ